MQELGKLNIKINVIKNELEKYMSFTINNKLRFVDSFQFLSFYPYKFTSDFQKNKEESPGKETFYSSITDEKISCKENEHLFNV